MMTNSFFDRIVDRITVGSRKKRVYVVAFFALFSMVVCSLIFIYGAFYKLELKIWVNGEVIVEGEEMYVKIDVPNEFFDKIVINQRVIIIDEKTKEKYEDFHIAEMISPEHERAKFFTVIALPSDTALHPNFKNGQKIKAEIIYKRMRVLDVLLRKEM